MGKRESLTQFQEADELFRAGRFEEALALLNRLDARYPGQKNILYPRALCLYKLRQFDESDAACDQLLARFGDRRAATLKRRIQDRKQQQLEEQLGKGGLQGLKFNLDGEMPVLNIDEGDELPLNTSLDALNIDPDAPTKIADKKPPAPEPRDWKKIGFIAAGVMAALLVIGLPILGSLNQPNQTTASETVHEGAAGEASQAASAGKPVLGVFGIGEYLELTMFGYTPTRIGWFGIFVLIGTVCYTINLYLTLLIANKLPHESFIDNLIHTTAASFACSFLTSTCLGTIAAITLLRSQYDFGIAEFALLFVFWVITGGLSIALSWGFYAYVLASFTGGIA